MKKDKRIYYFKLIVQELSGDREFEFSFIKIITFNISPRNIFMALFSPLHYETI